jgi:hypothetical protein
MKHVASILLLLLILTSCSSDSSAAGGAGGSSTAGTGGTGGSAGAGTGGMGGATSCAGRRHLRRRERFVLPRERKSFSLGCAEQLQARPACVLGNCVLLCAESPRMRVGQRSFLRVASCAFWGGGRPPREQILRSPERVGAVRRQHVPERSRVSVGPETDFRPFPPLREAVGHPPSLTVGEARSSYRSGCPIGSCAAPRRRDRGGTLCSR